MAAWLAFAGLARGQTAGELRVTSAPKLGPLAGRQVDEVRVETLGLLWSEKTRLTRVRAGDLLSGELVRRGLSELEKTGRFAELSGEIHEEGARLVLVFRVRPRRLVAGVRFEGQPAEAALALRALALGPEDELTDLVLARAQRRVKDAYAQAGYPDAAVRVNPDDTDDPLRQLVRVAIAVGSPERLERIEWLYAREPVHPDLPDRLARFALTVGTRLAKERIVEEAERLRTQLVEAGFYEAEVTTERPARGVLRVRVASGPQFTVRIEGNEYFGVDDLIGQLKLGEERDPQPEMLERRLLAHYVQHGFLDATVRFTRLDSVHGLRSELVAWIRAGRRFTVASRRFPCTQGSRTERELNSEVDGVLQEQFPGLTLVHPTDGASLDAALGTQTASPRASPLPSAPYSSYSGDAYAAVQQHLQNLYRAEAYLSAEVGPVTLVRRRCRQQAAFGECVGEGPLPFPALSCEAHARERSVVQQTCIPDPSRGVRCESSGAVVVPIRPGPQAVLHDVSLSGNRRFTERQLLELAALPVGQPARPGDLELGVQRILDRYADEGYAFAAVESDLQPSPDGTRARLSLEITERQQVRVSRVEIRGAERIREGLIRSRLGLGPGSLYRRAGALRGQEQIESLGVFTSVAVSLQDPGVPAREKVLVVTVSERRPQYVDIKGGFATSDGFRVGFEYGHRNLGGEAIQLVVRSQLGYRPTPLIPEADVRTKYIALQNERGLLALLERRNALSVAFPQIGLGPRFRFETELLDILDNNRDYGQTKDAGVLQLTYRPQQQLYFQLGSTVELNDAQIFGDSAERDQLDLYVQQHPEVGSTIRVPEGTSVAVTQNLRGVWDRRDKPLTAERGTYVSLGLEHVSAVPLAESQGTCNQGSTSVFAASCSEFLRYTARVAGYVPLSKKGLTLAVSLRAGVIQHLDSRSRTYPDRLFFVGGGDTIRGYPQDSLVPQDLANRVLSGDLAISSVVLRGGDLFLNPRAELRIPLLGGIDTALFVDSGNLWADPASANLLEWRYSVGTGLRVDTPVGPLVFDYGFNLERLLGEFGLLSGPLRTWEDIGAFHFSIGLF